MTVRAATRIRVRIRVTGTVQGVGYRPFVFALAHRLGVDGFVGNDSAGVFAEAEGTPEAVRAFIVGLRQDAPPLAEVEDVRVDDAPVTGASGFVISPSSSAPGATALISPDTATCPDCLLELNDPDDRRHNYAFTNCTNCGPRFTITRAVPYDRPNTTMAEFAMCATCAREYHDPHDRRFHAEPVCCPACGPQLRMITSDGTELADPIPATIEWLRAGRTVAVKGLGGYHLAADATNEAAVAELRSRKHREDKPFAILVHDIAAARRLCELDEAAERLLLDRARPIVLLARRREEPHDCVADSVAPHTTELGLLLPYTPLHHLLAMAADGPLVLTSGNVSDEPLAYRDDDARVRLAAIADAFLVHDRLIHMRTDDSVARTFRGAPMLLRRSRGYVPSPLPLPIPAREPVLGCGAELKSTFCLARDRHAFLSHHIGDLENAETLRSYLDGIAHFRGLFDVDPRVVAHDLHPEYLSTKHARSLDDVRLIEVQHHHAHIASCLADNGESGPVIGIACDGTGYGPDGTLWGGEVLVADLHGYERVAHLAPVPLPGGVTAIRQPWRMAAAYLTQLPYDPMALAVGVRNAAQWPAVAAVATSSLSLRTTSAGRLFDAVAALVGVRDSITYEGQAAIELEQRVDHAERGAYPMQFLNGALHGSDLVAGVVEDLCHGTDVGRIAARFHNGLAAGLATAALHTRNSFGYDTAALSGGVFQNVVLLTAVVDRLEQAGMRVLVHSRVPPNDGGISLGQAAIAAATTE